MRNVQNTKNVNNVHFAHYSHFSVYSSVLFFSAAYALALAFTFCFI